MNGMIALDDLRLFAAVARHASFVEAARRTGVPLSTISRRIQQLEESVRTRLLQRTSRRVALTQEGARLLERVGPLIDELVSAVEANQDPEPSGVLRVTAPVVTGTEWIGPALMAFAERHRRVDLDLIVTNSVLDLIEERVDLAIRVGPIRDRTLVARRLRVVPYTPCASPRFIEEALAGRTRVRPDTLRTVPAIMSGASTTWRLLRRDGSVEEVQPRARVRVNDPRLAATAAAQHLGVACVPEAILDLHALTPLTIVGRTLVPRELFAVYPARRHLPSRVRMALDWILEHR